MVHSLDGNRHFGNITLQQPFNGETNVTLIMVKAGFAKCRQTDSKYDNEESLELKNVEMEAAREKRGLWTTLPYQTPRIIQQVEDDPRVFLNANKGTFIPGIKKLT